MIIAQNIGIKPLMHVLGGWGLVMLAAGVTISATHRATYFRLHSAMAIHIINFIVQYLLVEMMLRIEVPNLRNELITETRKYVSGVELRHLEFSEHNINPNQSDWDILEKRMELTLVGMLSIYGILQFLLSFLMTLITGRAICCGRISLERKFYELQNLGSGHDRNPYRPGVMTLPDIHEVKNQKCQLQRKESENSESSLTSPCHSPPPYDSTTPRSSEDVTGAEDRTHDLNPSPSFNIKNETV